VDTGGAFHLGILQKATNNALLRLNPDWVVYIGMDTFIITDNIIKKEIERCRGNVITGPWLNIFNTGEERGNPFKTYFYYSQIRSPIGLIFKYHKKIQIFADEVLYRQKVISCGLRGAYVNFGNTKPARQRDETLHRRQLAWRKGMNKVWGAHYPVYKKYNWQWEKEKLKDIRQSIYWERYKKLWSL